jgi:hypothetical protein
VELVIAVGDVAEVATADAEIEHYATDAAGKLVA